MAEVIAYATGPQQEKSTLGLMLRALNSRNYRLFFFGQLVSLIGNWLTQAATAWLVFRLTGSPVWLGWVGFAGQIPAFLLSPLAGVLVDRWNLHRTLVVTQILAMLQSGALAWLTLTHHINIPWVLGLYIFQGFINAFDMPARQAFVVRMVDRREDLHNAIAINSAMVHGARMIGPSAAGILIALFGEGLCFTIDAASYAAVIVALLMMNVGPMIAKAKPRHWFIEFKEGMRYARDFSPIRTLLLFVAMMSLVGIPYSVLMPVFAANILHGGPMTLGLLMGASGIGALIGALWLAARKSVVGLGRIMPWASAAFGVGIILFAVSRWVWISMPLMVLTGFCMTAQMSASNALLQTLTDDDKRGRVMSLFGMAFQGMMPIGSLLAGYLADTRLHAPGTVALGGACCILGAFWFARQLPALRDVVRPIYIQRGILPPIARGMESAAEMSVPPEQ